MMGISYELGLESFVLDLKTLDNIYHMIKEQGEYSWEEILTFYNDEIEDEIKIPNAIVYEMIKKKPSAGNN